MKSKPIFLLLFLGLLLYGCNKSDDGTYVEPITLYEKVNGDWNLMNLKMIDEFAKANGIQPNEQNLSSLFNYQDFQIRFNVDEKMQPTSYEVTGNVPNLFAPSGYWQLSTNFQPTDADAVRIYLYSDSQKTQLTDELRLTSVPGSNGQMEIQLVRVSNGAAFVSYIFTLNANN